LYTKIVSQLSYHKDLRTPQTWLVQGSAGKPCLNISFVP
jgi:hypothetical protein